MTIFWISLVGVLGASSYLSLLVYIKNLHEGRDLTNSKFLGTLSVFVIFIIFMIFLID